MGFVDDGGVGVGVGIDSFELPTDDALIVDILITTLSSTSGNLCVLFFGTRHAKVKRVVFFKI